MKCIRLRENQIIYIGYGFWQDLKPSVMNDNLNLFGLLLH